MEKIFSVSWSAMTGSLFLKASKALGLRNVASFAAVAVFVCAVTYTGCKRDHEAPEWLSAVATDFSIGKFAPDLEDIVPGAALGRSDMKSLSRFAPRRSLFPMPEHRIVKRASEEMKVVKSTELRYIYEIDWLLENFDAMRVLSELCKSSTILQFESSGIVKQGVWQNGYKYEETPGGDRMVYISKKSERVKLSMYADGANEIYSSTTTGGKMDVGMYSYFKGDNFIYLAKQTEGTREEFRYLEFEQTNGVKKGTMIRFYYNPDSDPKFLDNGHKIWAWSFVGDDRYIEMYRHNSVHTIGSDMIDAMAYSSGWAYVYEDGLDVKCEISSTGTESISIDANALNINEIYLEEELPIEPNRGSVFAHSIWLDSGEKIIFEPFDIDMFNKSTYNFLLVNYLWDEQNQVAIKNEYLSGLWILTRLGFSGSLNDILSVRFPGLKAKINFDYERYRPVVNDMLTGFTPQVNTLKISEINVGKWDVFKKTMGEYMESKNTGFNEAGK